MQEYFRKNKKNSIAGKSLPNDRIEIELIFQVPAVNAAYGLNQQFVQCHFLRVNGDDCSLGINQE